MGWVYDLVPGSIVSASGQSSLQKADESWVDVGKYGGAEPDILIAQKGPNTGFSMIVGEVMYSQATGSRHSLVARYSESDEIQGLIIVDIRGPKWSKHCTREQNMAILQKGKIFKKLEPPDWMDQAQTDLLAGIRYQGVQWMEELQSIYIHSYLRSSNKVKLKLQRIWVC